MKKDGWRLEPHCCRICFGRIASRVKDEATDTRVYACSNCGVEAEGTRASVLCACGTKISKGKGKFVDAGLRCHENTARSPAFPAQYVVSYGGAQPEVAKSD